MATSSPALDRPVGAHHDHGSARPAVRWLPAATGLALGILNLLDLSAWAPVDWTTIGLVVLALAYLVIGAARRQLRRPGVLAVQTAGLAVFTALAVVALVVDPTVGKYVVAAGWFAHAAWDVAHHRDLSRQRAVGVVPRGYAEICIVIDLLVGASLLVAPLA